MTDSNQTSQQPGLVGGHAQYIKGATEVSAELNCDNTTC